MNDCSQHKKEVSGISEYCSNLCSAKMKFGEPNWMGTGYSYEGLHYHMKTLIEKPETCNQCGEKKRLDLANISQEYKLEIADWEWLCRKCHIHKDGHPKEIAGISDMKELANLIGDLHYETLAELLNHLAAKIGQDGANDYSNGRMSLGRILMKAGGSCKITANEINEAWQISKPFMKTVLKQILNNK